MSDRAAERLARLAGAGKPITGEGHSTAPTDPMLVAASLPSWNVARLEVARLIFMGDSRSESRLLRILTDQNAERHGIDRTVAYGLSYVAIHSLVTGNKCKSCKGAGVKHDQTACKPCEGSGVRVMSDRARARLSGIERNMFVRKYAEIADLIEVELHHIYADARKEIDQRQRA